MPGRSCAPDDAPDQYENVHVGVQRRRDVIDLVAGDATDATWTFEVTTRIADDGTTDFGGPFVHGRRGDRFLYLSWGTGTDDFRMFRRAKLHFADIDGAVLGPALRGGGLTGRVNMSDRCGNPRCARVRPPDVVWRTAT